MAEVPRRPLLACFSTSNQTINTLQREFRNITARKTNQMISNAIQTYIEHNQMKSLIKRGIQSQPNKETNILVRDLTEILNFKEEPVSWKRAQLFHEVIEDVEVDTTPTIAYDAIAKSVILQSDTWVQDYPAYFTVRVLCNINPTAAFKQTGIDKKIPFEDAAQKGATELIHVMLEELLEAESMKRISDLPKRKESAQTEYLSGSQEQDGTSAFLLAAQNSRLGVVKLLLQEYPGLADMKSLTAVIQNTVDEDERVRNAAMETFQQIVNFTGEKLLGQVWKEAVQASSLKVIRYLLKETKLGKAGNFVTPENAELLMKYGSKEMWNEFSPDDRKWFIERPSDKMSLLHTAVESRNAELVDEIIREFPDQIERQIKMVPKPCYPIHCLKGTPDEATYKRIRNTLLHAMIRSSSEDMGIRQIRKILKDSHVEADTICLHLTNIKAEEQSFTEYVQWLEAEDETIGNVFKFEKILKYAKFPDLHTQIPKHSEDLVASLRQDHNEIKIVMDWLQRRKTPVTQILELSVPDRLFCPHSDDDVRSCVVGWGIRVLNWRKLDLYLRNLTDKDDLEELHLYSSGNKSVHEQWYDELPTFTKLQRLYVHVVVDVLSEHRAEEVKKELQKELDHINRTNKNVAGRWTYGRSGLNTENLLVRGKSVVMRMVPVTEYHWETNTGYRTYRDLTEIKNDVVGPNLAAFMNKYHSFTGKISEFVGTKVAIIDSGVVIVGGKARTQTQGLEDRDGFGEMTKLESGNNPNQVNVVLNKSWREKAQRYTNDIAHHVVDGKSFVNTGDDEEQLWWHASEPHGTHMARLICSIDSRCKLYVIKVAETRSSGISANVVAEAIDWAIRRGVDVISLSFAAYTDTKEMSEAIMRASAKDIVVISSTADQGVIDKPTAANRPTHVNNKDVFTIAACNRWGNLLDPSAKEGFEFSFIGDRVNVGQVPFLESPEHASGSSVATAIAAGTASLIIACHRISENFKREHSDSKWRMRMVRDTFANMKEGNSRYVALENLCGRNVRLEDADFLQTVNNTFS